MSSIRQADPRARRAAIGILVFSFVFGFALITLIASDESKIVSWLESNLDLFTSYPTIPAMLMFVFALPVAAAGGYLLLYGHRTLQSKQIPPPNYSVLRDTLVLEGKAATRRGYIVFTLSVMIILTSASLPVFVWYIFTSLAAD